VVAGLVNEIVMRAVRLTMVLSLALAGACSGAGSTGPNPTTRPTTEASPAVSATEALDAIVLAGSEPPTGTELSFEDAENAGLQPVQDSEPEVQSTVQQGQVDTLIRLFFTPEMLEALDAGPEALAEYAPEFARSGHWSVGSWASAYETQDAAAAALALILDEFVATWQLERLDDPGLGDEGAILVGEPPQAFGVPTTIYLWRSGPYLLEVVAHGSVEADADEIRSIAEGMQSRVPGAAASTSVATQLDAIVVPEDAAPSDTELRKSFTGEFSGTQMVQDSAPEVRSAVLEGWIDALTREFASPETNDVIEGLASPDDLDPSDLHFVGSLASAYENAEAAQDALEAIRREMQTGSRGEETLSLGDGGVMFHEPFLGKTSFTFLWTSGSFLLVVRSDGMDENEMNALAEGMQSRVPAA
jgi:hypothetical protein